MDEPKARLHVGARAPNFTAKTTHGQITLSEYRGEWLVFFSHQGGFPHARTAWPHAFAQAAERFAALDVRLLGLGIAGKDAPPDNARDICAAADVHMPFPVATDRLCEIARLYGMPVSGDAAGFCGVYVIDPRQIIRSICRYPRVDEQCVEELMRLIAAMQLSGEEDAGACASFLPHGPGLITGPLFRRF